MATVTTLHAVVNPEERKLISKLRRIAKRHGLRLVRDRSHYSGDCGDRMYQLQANVVVAGKDFELTLQNVLAICNQLEGVR
jgi:hypothetical protein